MVDKNQFSSSWNEIEEKSLISFGSIHHRPWLGLFIWIYSEMPLNLRDLLCKHIIAFSQTSDAVVWFAHHTDSTADSIDFWGACHCSGVWIDFSNTQLDWSMVLSVNDTVAGWAVKSKKTKLLKIQFSETLICCAMDCINCVVFENMIHWTIEVMSTESSISLYLSVEIVLISL